MISLYTKRTGYRQCLNMKAQFDTASELRKYGYQGNTHIDI